ncbi:MAG: GSCFA domain-containing protein [Bacteroidetes bacterium]|nr:GSCFA domain-containing protein [Bacteroidales bacterium]NJO68544.1 GSCFA domain-containing protein [Bacteroidota bacterium]
MSVEVFRTIVQIQPSERKINYHTPIILVGSCFTENIGEKLNYYKFPQSLNPFGITYNPFSAAQSIHQIMDNKQFARGELGFANDLFYSFDHHSKFSDQNPEKCLNKINSSITQANNAMNKAVFLFITLGSAYYYTHKDSGKIVSNCHKLPDSEFNRSLAEMDDIVQAYNNLFIRLIKFNPELQVVFTISPIRHWKDGAHENQVSKAALHLSVEKLCRMFNHVTYFPAYELMLDELRDYRFYEEDMLHPNKTAIDFIWKRFVTAFMGSDTHKIMNEVDKIQLARLHRPFNANTEAFQSFVVQQINKIKYLTEQYPGINLTSEYEYFRSHLGEI